MCRINVCHDGLANKTVKKPHGKMLYSKLKGYT